MNGKRLTNKILANLEKPRPVRTEAEIFSGLSDEPEACCECHLSKSEFREGPVLRCLRCQKALCFLCTGVHLDCRNRCEEAK